MKFTSRWFPIYTLALLVCAPTCVIYRSLADYLAPSPAIDGEYVRHRAAADRMIAAALPPGWSIRSGLYITCIVDDDGTEKGYAYVKLAGDGRPYLTAGFHSGPGPPPAPAVWDLYDPESPGHRKAPADPPRRRQAHDLQRDGREGGEGGQGRPAAPRSVEGLR